MVKHQAFLDLEASLEGRLRRGFSRYWGAYYRQIQVAVERGDWDEAHRLVDRLDLAPVFESAKKFAETISVSAALLGASRLSKVRESRLAKKGVDWKVLNAAIAQLGTMLGRNATDELRRLAHAGLYEMETENSNVSKADNHASLDSDVAGTGKAFIGLASSIQVSRLSSWGFLVEAEYRGRTSYRIDAILDDRTCPVCEYLDGAVFPVSTGYAHADGLLLTEDPDTLKSIAPFYSQNKASIEALETYNTDDLIDEGLLMPPFHPMCRCILTETDEVPDVHYGDASDRVGVASAALYGDYDPKTLTRKLFGVSDSPDVSEERGLVNEVGGTTVGGGLINRLGLPIALASLLAWFGLSGEKKTPVVPVPFGEEDEDEEEDEEE